MAFSGTEQFVAVDVQKTAATKARYDRVAPGSPVHCVVAQPDEGVNEDERSDG